MMNDLYKNFLSSIFFLLIVLLLLPNAMAENSSKDTANSEDFVYDDKGKRDPFLPLVSPSGTLIYYEADYLISDLSLEGIIAGEENFAMINGKILGKGDAVGNFTVRDVRENSVILKKGGQNFVLKLKKKGE